MELLPGSSGALGGRKGSGVACCSVASAASTSALLYAISVFAAHVPQQLTSHLQAVFA